MASNPDEQFQWELKQHVLALRGHFTVCQLADIMHVDRKALYRWIAGTSTPIWLARQAALKILQELRKSLILRSEV